MWTESQAKLVIYMYIAKTELTNRCKASMNVAILKCSSALTYISVIALLPIYSLLRIIDLTYRFEMSYVNN